MTCYIVTFQPSSTESATRIRDRLRSLGAYCPIHRYCWAVLTEMNAAALRDHIGRTEGDRIFIVRSGTEAAWANSYGVKNSAWLKKNL